MLKKLIALLNEGTYSCIAADAEKIVYQAAGIGIKPIITPMRTDKTFFKNKIVADTKVGKAAAMLLALSGAKCVYGRVMSKSAVALLQKYQIDCCYETLAEYIPNRTNTGMCPLEMSIQSEDDLEAGFIKLENKIKELMKQKG